MSAALHNRYDPRCHERGIQLESDRRGASPWEVQTLLAPEFARCTMGAKVGAYIVVLMESSARGMLQRRARLAANLGQGPSAQDAATP
jgi:hypothetical protein